MAENFQNGIIIFVKEITSKILHLQEQLTQLHFVAQAFILLIRAFLRQM